MSFASLEKKKQKAKKRKSEKAKKRKIEKSKKAKKRKSEKAKKRVRREKKSVFPIQCSPHQTSLLPTLNCFTWPRT